MPISERTLLYILTAMATICTMEATPAQKGKTWKKSVVPRKKKGAKRTYLPEVRERIGARTKGRTLEEIYGEEKAVQIRDKLQQRQKARRIAVDKFEQNGVIVVKSSRQLFSSYGYTIEIVYKNGKSITVKTGVEAAELLGISNASISRIINDNVRPPEDIESLTKVKD